ncbi:hypothetical protein BC830DRAFT_1169297 [Chytriomyces sp. MP71]|nr:hypothetical protein BC830DRAFT_1169297 [Chytriomyces sp. MP71]
MVASSCGAQLLSEEFAGQDATLGLLKIALRRGSLRLGPGHKQNRDRIELNIGASYASTPTPIVLSAGSVQVVHGSAVGAVVLSEKLVGCTDASVNTVAAEVQKMSLPVDNDTPIDEILVCMAHRYARTADKQKEDLAVGKKYRLKAAKQARDMSHQAWNEMTYSLPTTKATKEQRKSLESKTTTTQMAFWGTGGSSMRFAGHFENHDYLEDEADNEVILEEAPPKPTPAPEPEALKQFTSAKLVAEPISEKAPPLDQVTPPSAQPRVFHRVSLPSATSLSNLQKASLAPAAAPTPDPISVRASAPYFPVAVAHSHVPVLRKPTVLYDVSELDLNALVKLVDEQRGHDIPDAVQVDLLLAAIGRVWDWSEEEVAEDLALLKKYRLKTVRTIRNLSDRTWSEMSTALQTTDFTNPLLEEQMWQLEAQYKREDRGCRALYRAHDPMAEMRVPLSEEIFRCFQNYEGSLFPDVTPMSSILHVIAFENGWSEQEFVEDLVAFTKCKISNAKVACALSKKGWNDIKELQPIMVGWLGN